MALRRKERLRAHLLHMPFDYPIRPYRMSLTYYFVRALEADYRYMALRCKERLRAHLLHMPFDYPICPYRMSLTYYFVRALEAQTHSERITGGLSAD